MANFSLLVNISEEGNHTFCVRISEKAVECDGVEYVTGGESYYTYREGDFWLYLCLYMAFVLIAGDSLFEIGNSREGRVCNWPEKQELPARHSEEQEELAWAGIVEMMCLCG